ncbi:MAG TPA: TMEM175 family protein [Myxococcota bacterium]|nr:TMEM175 family protein [Myxococcota bacterium]
MKTSRLEAFSDGVIAIIITIMVLELRAPPGGDLTSLRPVLPGLLTYVLSFAYLGIYWNNHHHMLNAAHSVNGAILWANLHLLFWLSLIPFVTGWLGEHHGAPWPTAMYGIVMLLAGISYTVLQRAIIRHHGRNSELATAVGRDFKGKLSMAGYVAAIGLAFTAVWWVSDLLYVAVALVWVIPDRRIEAVLRQL